MNEQQTLYLYIAICFSPHWFLLVIFCNLLSRGRTRSHYAAQCCFLSPQCKKNEHKQQYQANISASISLLIILMCILLLNIFLINQAGCRKIFSYPDLISKSCTQFWSRTPAVTFPATFPISCGSYRSSSSLLLPTFCFVLATNHSRKTLLSKSSFCQRNH